jgi:iron(III) transport system ATP-binding protein
MVFQSYAVWPHMTVWGNVAYPLQMHKVGKEEVDSRVRQILLLVGLSEMVDRNVTKLSGGQQQRVVLARALVHNPRMLLFDEPLSNLDARLRVSMRFEIRQLQQRVGISALYVTHDQTEAMVLSDRVIVMNQGRIEQVGHPLEIYRKPVSAFVASFFGEVNFLEGTIAPFDEPAHLVPVEIQVHGKTQVLSAYSQTGMKAEDRVYVSIRPQDIEVVSESAEVGGTPAMRGKVSRIVHMGSHVEYCIDVGELQLNCHCVHDLGQGLGAGVKVVLRPERCICVSR